MFIFVYWGGDMIVNLVVSFLVMVIVVVGVLFCCGVVDESGVDVFNFW